MVRKVGLPPLFLFRVISCNSWIVFLSVVTGTKLGANSVVLRYLNLAPAVMKTFATLLILLCCTIGISNPGPSKYGPVSEGYFRGADGVRLFYRKVGTGKNTVVFLHGGPGLGINDGGHDMEPLARGRTLLMYDQRGSGRSEIVTDPKLLTVEYQVRDLEEFRKHFKLERMTLVGLSWGTGLAVLYASAHPERVEKLLLVSPMPPAKTPYWEQRTARLNSLIGPGGAARSTEIRQLLPKASDAETVALCREAFTISSGPYFLEPQAQPLALAGQRTRLIRERVETMCDAPPAALRNRFVVVFAVFDSLGDWDFRPLLGRIKAPALVIEGEQTNVPLDATRAWSTALPNGRLLLIPNAGHVHFIEQPKAFFAAANQFIHATR
jgi:proline iminopeptidase